MAKQQRDGGHDTSGATREARGRVAEQLARLERSERDALHGLQGALCSYVGALKGEGASADQVTAAVRELVRTPATPDAELVIAPAVREALVHLAVSWCAAEFARQEEMANSNARQDSRSDGERQEPDGSAASHA